ncbi:hypothetical protein Ddc_08856 [Ditylenchus destructor]|nr:hypothetical protein Ddc_08856 [Ditylenchus destructor]
MGGGRGTTLPARSDSALPNSHNTACSAFTMLQRWRPSAFLAYPHTPHSEDLEWQKRGQDGVKRRPSLATLRAYVPISPN